MMTYICLSRGKTYFYHITMNEKKIKWMFFLIGLLSGLVIGGISVRLYTDKVYSENLISQNVVARLFGKMVGLVYKQDKSREARKTSIEENHSYRQADSTKTLSESGETEEPISNHLEAPGDTAAAKKQVTEDENIVVLQDQLMGIKKITPMLITGKLAGQSSDSLLGSAAGIKPNKSPEFYTIEYWQSPLNFRGYKLGKNKIVLYGINQSEPLKLFVLNQMLYMNFQNQFVKIESHYDFKSFEKITDANLVGLLEAAGKGN